MPTNSCGNKYGLAEFGRRISSAMIWETKNVSGNCADGIEENAYSHVVGRMMVINDKESRDSRCSSPATSTQRGPIVYQCKN